MHSMKLLVILLLLAITASAEPTYLTLLNEVSSKMATGSPFSARDEASGKIYTGYVVTQKARNFLRRGWIRLTFDEPIRVVDPTGEGVFHPGHKRQIILVGTTPLIAKLADDAVDTSIGSGKARVVGAAAGAGALFFMKGGNITLKPGYKLQVEPAR